MIGAMIDVPAMQQDERQEAAARLCKIRNIGPAMAADLIKLGITRLEDAAGQDPDGLYFALCAMDGTRHDPCVRDVFAAVVAQANGEAAQPWWAYTARRKARDAEDAATEGATSGRRAAHQHKNGRMP